MNHGDKRKRQEGGEKTQSVEQIQVNGGKVQKGGRKVGGKMDKTKKENS